MALITQSYLKEKARSASASATGYTIESYVRTFAANSLSNEKRAASAHQTFDIFLSHASEDAILIKALRDELVSCNYSVYVDWIDDPHLDRSNVTKHTAATLRERMHQCKCLLLATSDAAKRSVWMPWELGYMDARTTSRVAIVPMVTDSEQNSEFKGQEYLGLYPYLDKTSGALYIHSSNSKWVKFIDWLKGANP